jgi:hypothetical protein
MPNFDFQFDQNDVSGSLAKLMRYMKWFNANLDGSNIRYFAWGDSIVDNVDSSHKLKLKFYIPDGVMKVQKLTLNFSVEAFRAYETGAASGGGSSKTSSYGGSGTFYTTDDAGMGIIQDTDEERVIDLGPHHVHGITIILPDHSHDITIPSHAHDVDIPDHTHGITYGIYESTTAQGCKVYVDGVLRLSNGGTGYSTDQSNLDLTQWVSTAGWHYIEISSSQLGRINAAYFAQVYVGASGI